MRFWLARHSEVPIREQLRTQVLLGILGDELPPGRRLPSTRDLARRFGVHANTISAAYRQLERERWVEFRRGSGVYVRRTRPRVSLSPELQIDHLIGSLFRSAREAGTPLSALRARLRQWLAVQPPDHFLLVEPDEELRRIVCSEITGAVQMEIAGCGLEECRRADQLSGAIVLALPSKVEAVQAALPAGTECVALRVRSVPQSLAAWLPAPSDALVGVASRWPGFLDAARTMLVAAGFDSDGLVLRDARADGWSKGLRETAAVVCDSVTAPLLPKGCRAIVFPLLAPASFEELRRYQEFLVQP
jgi:DNA-binding transcriptional regulator YhcF (GntR family)